VKTLALRRVKSVEFAYPSSHDARRFVGFAKTGCWTVNVGWSGEPLKAITAHATRAAALANARGLGSEWDAAFRHIHPADCGYSAPLRVLDAAIGNAEVPATQPPSWRDIR